MAIQEIEKSEVKGTVGIKRSINIAAEGMVMDIVQAQQYTKPVPSTVRELTSNAVDSQSEKERAIDILSGKAKPEDFFVKREGALYADSNWDESYYDINHFDMDNNNIELIYRVGKGIGRCDSFEVIDYGVGIGKRRLEGIFEIGFSTKRNRKDALGSFGLGAKVGLSTGADYYTVETCYNGVKYIVKVFNRKINSMISSLNLETGESNIPYTFSNGEVIYGEKTSSKNYTKVIVPALKHHKDDYIHAVKTTLLYFRNVTFRIESEDATQPISFSADVLYNSENLIISKNSPYSKPHIIIIKGGDNVDKQTGVCYGHVEFAEMELQDMYGDIGIKCPVRQVIEDENGNEIVINEGVDIVPSRESVRWTSKTREFLKQQFAKAQQEATALVEEELANDNLYEWLKACISINGSRSRDTVLGRLSSIVDMNSLTPIHKKTNVKFSIMGETLMGLKVEVYTKILSTKFECTKLAATSWNQFNKVYIKHEDSNRYVDCFLADKNNGSFCVISLLNNTELNKVAYQTKGKRSMEESIADLEDYRQNLLSTLIENGVPLYPHVDEIPLDYKESLDLSEKRFAEKEAEDSLTPAEIRKMNGRVVYHSFKERYNPYFTRGTESFQLHKSDISIENVKNLPNLYYGFQEDMSKLHYACHIIDRFIQVKKLNSYAFSDNDYIKIVTISKTNKKAFKNCKHIDDFFGEVVNDTLVMNKYIVDWNTARKIQPFVIQMKFCEGFMTINRDVYDDYITLKKFVDEYYSDLTFYNHRLGVKEHHANMIHYLDNVEKLQEAVERGDTETVSECLTTLPKVSNGIAVNRDIINLCENVYSYVKPLKGMLNNIPFLTDGLILPLELEMEVKEFINYKQVKYEKKTSI